MSPEPGSRRPVGWWVKEADRRLDAAFDRCLRTGGADRRAWQVLASLAGRPMARAELVAGLAPFDSPERVAGVVDGLLSRGLVDGSGIAMRLTPAGEQLRADLAPRVDEVRRRVAEALPGDEYATLLRLLEQLVTALDEAWEDAEGR